MKEYGELEKQMKKAIADIEKREKQINTREQEVKFIITISNYFIFSSFRFNVCKLI